MVKDSEIDKYIDCLKSIVLGATTGERVIMVAGIASLAIRLRDEGRSIASAAVSRMLDDLITSQKKQVANGCRDD